MIEKFRDGTGCMLKQAVLFEFSFWIFFFTSRQTQSLNVVHIYRYMVDPALYINPIKRNKKSIYQKIKKVRIKVHTTGNIQL